MASNRYGVLPCHSAYVRADRKAKAMPIALMVLGVNPILWDAFASAASIFWIFSFSLVSIVASSFFVLVILI